MIFNLNDELNLKNNERYETFNANYSHRSCRQHYEYRSIKSMAKVEETLN